MTLRIGRIIIGILISLSVATLPVAAGFAVNVPTASEVPASVAMPDCSHSAKVPSGQTQKTTDNCASMAACALTCFNFTGTALSGFVYLPLSKTALKPIRITANVLSRMESPPFRPPRI
ncbi:MAG: hypothetical protein Q8M24_08620 [Pseudolabrys sp.]|nr:hypothetical protein [Pseudolabrys sp.]MDP2295510.1 hypothetical protein [Pseudolabrys sp.]